MDYKLRIKKLQAYIKKSGLSAFLVLTKTNRIYLSGFTGSKGYLLVTKSSAKLFVDDRYTIRARKESPLSVAHVSDLKKSMKSLGKVGIEDAIRLAEFNALKKMKLGASFLITSGVIEQIRAIKSAKEIASIKKGSQIIDKTFGHIKTLVKKKGITEMDLALEIERFGKKQGADGLAFDPIIAFGPSAAAPHHFSSNKKIGRNNFLLLDFGMLVRGYHSDFTRTLFLGLPNKLQEQVYNTVFEAQLVAVDQVRAGNYASRVDKKARDLIDGVGFGDKFTHNTGHGVGLAIHELPNFSSNSKDLLQDGMIVTVEPGIYLEKKFGVRIEDMVIVKKQSPTVLSKVPKDLKSMIIK